MSSTLCKKARKCYPCGIRALPTYMKKLRHFLFKNTSAKQTAVKNSFWLTTGEILGRLLKLAIVVFATRRLGVDGWGQFSYALAFIGFFYFLSDMGINTFIIRELSRDAESRHRYLSTALISKLCILAVLTVLAVALGPNLGRIRVGLDMILVLCAFSISESVRDFAMSINRSLEKMEREAFSKVLVNGVILIAGVILLVRNANPLALALAYAVGSVAANLYILWSVRGELAAVDWSFSRRSLREIFNFSWPVMVIGFFGYVFNLDSIVLGQLRPVADVGLYAAAQRLVGFLPFLPGIVASVIFPMLSKNESDDAKYVRIFEQVLLLVLALALPIAIGGFIFRSQILVLIYGPAYAGGALALGILMLSLLAIFPNILLSYAIFSKNLQRIFLRATIVGVACNIVLMILLIPRYGVVGAAISTTLTEMVLMTMNWIQLKRHVPFSVLPKTGRILGASLLMTLAIVALNAAGLSFLAVILLAIVVYGLALMLLKEPILREILSLRQSI